MNVPGTVPTQNNPSSIPPLRDPHITIRRIVNAELLQIQEAIRAFGFVDPFSLLITDLVRTFRAHHLVHADTDRVFREYSTILQETLQLHMAMYIDNHPGAVVEPYPLVRYMMDWLGRYHLAEGLNDLWNRYNQLYNQRKQPGPAQHTSASPREIIQKRRAIQAERRRQRQEQEQARAEEISSIRNDFRKTVVPNVDQAIQDINSDANVVLDDIQAARAAYEAEKEKLRKKQEQLSADIDRLEEEDINLDLDLENLDERIDAAEKEDKQFQKDINNLAKQVKKNKKKWIGDLLKAAGGVAIGLGVSAVMGGGVGFIPKPDGGLLNVLFKV